jgi:hypothetical protein
MSNTFRAFPASASLLASAVAMAAGGCGDELVAPDEDATVPLAVSAVQQEQMRVELLFAQEQSILVLQRSEGSAVTAALAALTQRVERNDRLGVERGVASARTAIQRYQDLAGGDNAVDPDLEVLSLTLDQVAFLATTTRAHQEPQP